MNVYVSICVCVCIYMCVYLCVFICVSECICVCVCMYLCVCICEYMYIMCMYFYVWMCIYLCACVWMYMCVCVCVSGHMRMLLDWMEIRRQCCGFGSFLPPLCVLWGIHLRCLSSLGGKRLNLLSHLTGSGILLLEDTFWPWLFWFSGFPSCHEASCSALPCTVCHTTQDQKQWLQATMDWLLWSPDLRQTFPLLIWLFHDGKQTDTFSADRE